jgi:hypothetical protein
MKRFWIIVLLFFSLRPVIASQFIELQTKSGKIFRSATVIGVLATAVQIEYEDGIAVIPLDDLPDDVERRYRAEADGVRQKQVAMAHVRLTKVFKDTPIQDVIRYYAQQDHSEAIVASNVSGTFSFEPPLRKAPPGYSLYELRDALLAKRGIIITDLDDKRTSVTYNDALDPQRAAQMRR